MEQFCQNWTKRVLVFFWSFLVMRRVTDALLLEAQQFKITSYETSMNTGTGLVPGGPQNTIFRNLTFAAGLTVDVRGKYIFYSDVGEKKTYKIDYARNPPERENIMYGWGSVEGLSADWIAKNLFWTDNSLNHVAVSRYDGTHRKIIIQDDIGEPRGIAVHPTKGYVFWSDISSAPKIERSDMTGNNRVVLINFSLIKTNGLAIDFANERLYFVDSGLDNIESVDFNGRDRTLIANQYQGDFFDVAVMGEYLYASSFTSGVLEGAITSVKNPSSINPVVSYKTVTHSGYGFGIAVYDECEQPGTTGPCGVFNGGCEHLCLPVDTSTFRCDCSSGFTLDSDKRTCRTNLLDDPFLLVADSALNKIFQVDSSSSYSTYSTVPLRDTLNPVGLAYDPVQSKLYWTDGTLDEIFRSNLDGTNQEKIVSESIRSPTGLTIDPIRRFLYWTDEQLNLIEKSDLDGSNRIILVESNLDNPRGISVNQRNGDIYWTDWGAEPKIEKISSDGTKRLVIIDTDLYWPNGLAVDSEGGLFYWCDVTTEESVESQIEVADLDGGNRRVLVTLSTFSHPFGLTISGEMLFYTDWSNNALMSINRFENRPRALTFGPKIFLRMHGIVASANVEVEPELVPNEPITAMMGENSGSEPQNTDAFIFIVAGGGAVVIVILCLIIAAVFLVNSRTKRRRQTRVLSPSRQPNIPIPPTPLEAGAVPSKSVNLPEEDPIDPFSGNHIYMDLDSLTAKHVKEPPPPYSPRKTAPHDAAFFDNPSLRRDHEPRGAVGGYISYHTDEIDNENYIDPLADTYQASIQNYPPADYMETIADLPYPPPEDYMVHNPSGQVVENKTYMRGRESIGSYMALRQPNSYPEDPYLDPLSTQESLKVIKENRRKRESACHPPQRIYSTNLQDD